MQSSGKPTRGGPAPGTREQKGSLCPPRVAGVTRGAIPGTGRAVAGAAGESAHEPRGEGAGGLSLVEPSQRAGGQVNVGTGDHFHHRTWWKEDWRGK